MSTQKGMRIRGKAVAGLAVLTLAGVFAAGCGDDDDIIGIDDQQVPLRGAFILSNEMSRNDVVFYPRNNDGTLGNARRFDTGGTGTGESLTGSAHPLEFTQDRRFLLAVSSGSDQLTAFRVTEQGLQRTAVVPSGGKKPFSVSVRNDGLVYVLNVNGGEGGLTGFRLSDTGNLTRIPNSERRLSGDATMPPALPSQVEFSPDGRVVVVTERFSGPNTNGRIITFTVGADGLLSQAIINPPFGRTPFGMDFTANGILLVSEGFVQTPGNPIPNEGKLSSFRVSANGALEVISRSVPGLGSATCWVQPSEDGRFAWATNTGSANLTTYAVGTSGTLTRLRVVPTGMGPIGMGLTVGGEFLHVLNAGSDNIMVFRVRENGELTQVQAVSVPNSSFGIKSL